VGASQTCDPGDCVSLQHAPSAYSTPQPLPTAEPTPAPAPSRPRSRPPALPDIKHNNPKQGGDDAPTAPSNGGAPELEESYLSALPFLPPLTNETLNTYYTFYAGFVATVIVFGALLAPLLEVKIGLGGGCLDFEFRSGNNRLLI
jgi:hypothetical protein